MSEAHDRDGRSEVEHVFELAVALVEGMDRGLSEHGLSRARAEVLWALGRCGPVTQRQLAETLLCSPRNVTTLLDALEANELVRRTRHPDDRRAVLVELTNRGAHTAEQLRIASAGFAVRLFDDLPPHDEAAFHRVVQLLLHRMRPTETTTRSVVS